MQQISQRRLTKYAVLSIHLQAWHQVIEYVPKAASRPRLSRDSRKGTKKMNEQQQAIVLKKRELLPPQTAQVIPVSLVLGRNPPRVNLRDHGEYSGHAIIIDQFVLRAGITDDKSGIARDYAIMRAWIFPAEREPVSDDCVILQTGAENIVQRLREAAADPELTVFNDTHFEFLEGAVLRGTLTQVKASQGHTVWTLD